MSTIKFRIKCFLFVGLLSISDVFTSKTELGKTRRESRKLFGGYRITPKHCIPTRTLNRLEGPTVCMFNHECSQRNGHVVGTCMDGFLFGACCQLSEDLVGELTLSEEHPAQVPSNSLNFVKDTSSSKKPPVYGPFTSGDDDIALDGVSKITAALLHPDLILTAEENETLHVGNFHAQFSTTGVTHPTAPDTFILNQNDKDNTIYSDLFNNPSSQFLPAEDRRTTYTLPETTPSYSHHSSPYIQISISNSPIEFLSPTAGLKRPSFKPKPSLSSDEYILVPTVTHKPNKTSDSITQESSYQSPASTAFYTKMSSSKRPPITTWATTPKRPPSTSYVYSSTPLPPRPGTQSTKAKPSSTVTYWSSSKPSATVTYGVSSPKPSFQKISSTLRPAFPSYSDHTTHKSPLTSHTYTTSYSKQPLLVSNPSSSYYNTPSQHSSSSTSPPPTIIVLGPSEEYSSPLPLDPSSTTSIPLRRPVTQVTINNHVTHTVYAPTPSPSVLITPKPSSITSKPLRRPTTEFQTTGESETSLNNDLINFPPVRNPNLNISAPHEDDITTPSFVEDEALNSKVESFVNKIVQGLQEPFQGLKDVVYNKNTTLFVETTTKKTTRKTTSTKKPTATAKPSTRRTTKRPSSASATKRTTTTTTTTSRTTPLRKITTTTTPSYIETIAPPLSSNDYRHVCGIRPLVKSGRIVGGKQAAFGAFPWQVLVRESTWLGLFTKNKCGGVLISNKFVITAAHCQPGFLASLVAVFGDHDISGDKEKKRAITRNVKRVIVHREYDPLTFENDLALLELENPVAFDEHIIPICLPKEGTDFTGRVATVTGWGRLKYGGAVPSILQEVQVPIMENHVCQEMFKTAHHDKKIRESFLCAGYANGQKDSCEGDSGGPLVLQRADGRWELAGTVSHGIKCAAPYLPGVYMRTAYYKPWLESITGVH
ncbi:serine proteinase stubble [Agrilus planipennis]|uniref:Serine proteinase stubble n=1 Tax=Agrilus planipennis TaxID=224129 RepID=A0A7F5R290_AGRPL|nr:serine proteinase stubble [Agrilus planipennis]